MPSQANSLPFLKAAPLPIAAVIAVVVIGPMPGIATVVGRLGSWQP